MTIVELGRGVPHSTEPYTDSTQHRNVMQNNKQRGGVGAAVMRQFVSNTRITKAMNGQDVTPFPKKITMPHAPPLKHPANPMNG